MSTGALVGLIIVGAVVVLGAIAAVAAKGQKPVAQRICGGCRRAMLPQWPRCLG